MLHGMFQSSREVRWGQDLAAPSWVFSSSLPGLPTSWLVSPWQERALSTAVSPAPCAPIVLGQIQLRVLLSVYVPFLKLGTFLEPS